MPESTATIIARIERLTTPGHRRNLLARGLARGLVWRDGQLPPEAPSFSPELSSDLLDHGFQLLSSSLNLRAAGGDLDVILRGLNAAAESLESAARYEGQSVVERGFYLTMAAASFHIGGFAARAYSLFEGSLANFNLSSCEAALVYLMRRDLTRLRQTFMGWLNDEQNSDDFIVQRLRNVSEEAAEDDFGADEVVAMALIRHFHRAISVYEYALVTGSARYFRRSIDLLFRGAEAASQAKHVPWWWAFRIARHLCEDLWGNSLRVVLPKDGGPRLWPKLREEFIRMLVQRKTAEVDLWPSQIAAAGRVVNANDDLVVALPTSAGKTRIAELCILRALADEKRIIYVTPLRALSAQIEHGLARTFRPLGISVTSVYGASGVASNDLETLKSAKIVVATPEKLDFAIRQEPEVIDDVGLIVLDEGHMIGLSEREIRYEMLVQRLLRRKDAHERRLVCLSAVFSEGEAFSDFTAWLRSDSPGEALRSTWRPTRLRPGLLTWTGSAGRLELEVDEEVPFVPRFVDSQTAVGQRKNAFPQNDQEFIVAATSSFLARDQTVLIYCPLKKSVEPTAEAFLKAHKQGFFSNQLNDSQLASIEDAKRIGEEWLGPAHPAVCCLEFGIAVHHGSLPRHFLSEIETLLRRRLLPVCVCSPTLAQGLDLSFGVLLFRSIYRNREPIPAKEFANVVGRVGRAFVDLDGLFILPIFEENRSKATFKATVFRRLIRHAQSRQLESGVRDLIGGIIFILTTKLGCNHQGLAEYVLNTGSTWSFPLKPDDETVPLLNSALNELDTAILGIIDTLELPVEELADYLDNCLQGSYWRRRLSHASLDEQDIQSKVIKGRAIWLWSHTNTESRRACFASGVGNSAGRAIESSLDPLRQYLAGAESELANEAIPAAASHAASAASILFEIHPFVPDYNVANLTSLIEHWLSGAPLSSYGDPDAVGFIQDHIVYRLVWAVEAARLHMQHTMGDLEEPPGDLLALCLTYGVANAKSALLLQAGIRSRSFAMIVAKTIQDDISSITQLKTWVRSVQRGATVAPVWKSEEQAAEWKRFLDRFGHRHERRLKVAPAIIRATWSGDKPPGHKTTVRVLRSADSTRATIHSVSSLPIGICKLPKHVRGSHFIGRVRKGARTVRIYATNTF